METYDTIEKMHKELEDIIKETNSNTDHSSDSDSDDSINDNYISTRKTRLI